MMMDIKSIAAALVALACAAAMHFFYRLYQHRRQFRDLPKPPHSFLWGHLKVMGEVAATLPPNCHPQAYWTTIAQKYNLKGIYYLDLWPMTYPQVILTEPELMDQVQVSRSFDQHPVADEGLAPIIGPDVIATANGNTWKKMHSAMAPAFMVSHVRTLAGLMADETLLFRDTLGRLADSGEVFSLEREGSKLIFDMIARIVFNFPLHAQTRGSAYLDDLRELERLVKNNLSINPVDKIKVWLRKHALRRRVNAAVRKQIFERLEVLRDERIVPDRRNPLSILDLMLRETVLKEGDAGGGVKGPRKSLPEEEVKLLVTNIEGLLLGGQGTTTDTLCYIYMLLSTHPEAVQKLRAEHDTVFHPGLSETVNILENSPFKLNDLEYTTAVIKETLRLFPVGNGARRAPPGTTIKYNDRLYPIDDNKVVLTVWHSLHYNPQYYPSPSTFSPERFVADPNSDTDTDPVPRSWWRPFSRGSRACLGQNLAMDELRVILLLTVRDFDFKCAGLKPNKTPKASYSDLDTVYGDIVFQELAIEAKPRGGMMMTVERSGYAGGDGGVRN